MRILQRDGRTPFTDVAKKCKVSTDAIIRRFNKMKKMGIISGTTVYLILKTWI
ncbi:MAG: Lrp/AsnC family transcriptional regulator [Candidatus Baldrarchaeota archaeon]